MPRLLDAACKVMAGFAALCILFIVVSVSWGVVARHLFDSPPMWAVEVSEYLQVYLAFLGAAWVLRKGGHVRLDLITASAGPRTRRILALLADLFGAAVSIIVGLASSAVAWIAFSEGTPVIKALEIPKWVVLVPIPIGCLLLALEFIRRLFDRSEGT